MKKNSLIFPGIAAVGFGEKWKVQIGRKSYNIESALLTVNYKTHAEKDIIG